MILMEVMLIKTPKDFVSTKVSRNSNKILPTKYVHRFPEYNRMFSDVPSEEKDCLGTIYVR